MKIRFVLILILMAGMFSVVAQKNVNLKTISLPDAQSNQKVSLADYANTKALVIIFTSNFCPYSKLYENRIDRLASAYADKGFQFILINSNNPTSNNDDSLEEMAKKASDKGYKYPYLADKEQKLQTLLGATKTPEVYVLRPHMDQFQVVYFGGLDDNPQVEEDVSKPYLKDAIEAIINKREPQVKNTRATGCMIRKN